MNHHYHHPQLIPTTVQLGAACVHGRSQGIQQCGVLTRQMYYHVEKHTNTKNNESQDSDLETLKRMIDDSALGETDCSLAECGQH